MSCTIKDVCPELGYQKGLGIYLDCDRPEVWAEPDSFHKNHLIQLLGSYDCFNFIVISGSTGVTRENASRLSDLLQDGGYPKKRIGLIVPRPDVVSDNYGFIVITNILNSRNQYFREELARTTRKEARSLEKKGVLPISMAYLLVEPADQLTVGKVTDPDVIKRKDDEKIRQYCKEADRMGFSTLSLEAGSGAETTVPASLIDIARNNFRGDITVGGGIKTPEQITLILNSGADLVTLGDVLEKSSDIGKLLLSFKISVRRIGR